MRLPAGHCLPRLLAALRQRRVRRLLGADGIGRAVESGLVPQRTDLHGAHQGAGIVELDPVDPRHAVARRLHRQRTGQRFTVGTMLDLAAGFFRMDLP